MCMKFKLREHKIDYDMPCEEIEYGGEWVTFGEICDTLNEKVMRVHILEKEKEIIKEKLLKYILEYNKVSNDNWCLGFSEALECMHDEVEELFKNPFGWEYSFDCDDCKFFREIGNNYDKANCIKFNKEIGYWDVACGEFKWK